MTIRTMLVDDHPIVREGLRAVLSAEPDIEVVAECGDGGEGVTLAAALRPDVVLMDLRLPVLDGLAATKLIVDAGHAAVLVLSTYSSNGDVTRAIAAGATGYLLKDAPRHELAAAVRAAARGETVLAPPVAAALAGHESLLTRREMDVLRGIARGLSNPEIGRELFVAEATVKSHVTNIFDKLGVKDRTAAVLTAIARGDLPPP